MTPRARTLLNPAFSPLALGPVLWLDADDSSTLFQDSALTTPAVADSDPVGGWKDKSGNGNHWTQSTAGLRPLLKLAARNGRNGVRFDGIDDQLENAGISLGANHSVFVVFNSVDTSAADYHTIISYTATGTGLYAAVQNASIWTPNVYFSGAHLAPTQSNGSFGIYSHIVNSTINLTARYNFSQFLTSTSFLSFNPSRIGGRGSQYLTGNICEIVVFTQALTDTQVTNVEGYLQKKWGL